MINAALVEKMEQALHLKNEGDAEALVGACSSLASKAGLDRMIIRSEGEEIPHGFSTYPDNDAASIGCYYRVGNRIHSWRWSKKLGRASYERKH